MDDISAKRRRAARYMLFRYKLSKFSYIFKQVFFLYLGILALYRGYLLIKVQGNNAYYLYGILFIGLMMFCYGVKGCLSLFKGFLLKKALINGGVKMQASIYRIEYIESWSTYQKGSFIFARPESGVLEGMNVIFKSERFNFKIPAYAIKPGSSITVYVDPHSTNNYWMDVESILRKILKEKQHKKS